MNVNMTVEQEKKHLSVREAAQAADVHTVTIYRWIYEGILPATKGKTGRWRIYPRDLNAVLYGESMGATEA